MRNAYLAQLFELAKDNKQILAVVADNGAIVYDKFRAAFPGQFINFGISEANMVSVSAGMASCGKIPFCYTISNFLTMRAFEQIRNDVCLQKMNVKLIGIGGGFVYSNLGPTHHATEDIALMNCLPFMTIFSPCDPLESKKVTKAAAEIDGPVYIRLATGGTPALYRDDYDFQVGQGMVLKEGGDVTVITSGNITHEVVLAVDEAVEAGISVRLINMPTIKPIDERIIQKAVEETKAILTVEEHSLSGGLGSIVASVIFQKNLGNIKLQMLGLKDRFPSGYGSYQDMKEINGLSKKDILREIKMLFHSKKEKKG